MAADPDDTILDELDATERGFVLGALMLHPSGRADLAAVLEQPSDARCAGALARIASLPRAARVRLTGHLAREVVAPIPPGIDAVDDAVLADLFRDESPEIVRLVMRAAPPRVREAAAAGLDGAPAESLVDNARAPALAGEAPREVREVDAGDSAPVPGPSAEVPHDSDRHGDASPPGVSTRTMRAIQSTSGEAGSSDEPEEPQSVPPEMVAELQRAVFARVAAVPTRAAASSRRGSLGRQLLSLSTGGILRALTEHGADVLGASLRGNDRELILRTAALVGAPWAERIVTASRVEPRAVGAADAGASDGGTTVAAGFAGGSDAAGTTGDPAWERAAAVKLASATTPAASPRETVTRVGARAVGFLLVREGARGLGGAEQARALAQRLPQVIGAELLAAAGLGPKPNQPGGVS